MLRSIIVRDVYSARVRVSRCVSLTAPVCFRNTRWDHCGVHSSRLCIRTSCNTPTTDMEIPKRAFKQGSTCPPSRPDTLRLYSMRFCPFALRTRCVLSYKNISHETVNINLLDKPDWFLAKNPKGLVPVLEYNDKIVYESAICNEYLDAIYPEVTLTPADPYIRARQQILMDAYSPISRGFYRIAGAKTAEDKQQAMAKVTAAMKVLDDSLESHFFGGATPTLFDFYAYPHLWMFDFVVTIQDKISSEEEMAGYAFPRDFVPRLTAWLERMKRLPAVVANTEKAEDMMRFVHSWRDRANGIDYDAGLTSSKL